MKRGPALLAVLLWIPVAVTAQTGATAQVERGRQLFLKSSKGVACATCHSLEGAGTAVGPDLTRLASVIGPRVLVTTIQMTMTAYVQEVRTTDGRTFPGIQKQKDGETVQIYDLSRSPATLLKMRSSEIVSMKPNTAWTHPPTSAGYSDGELADVVAYLKYVSTGVLKEVTAGELR
jgi:putative heme-binding domain-containing protein